MSKNPPEDQAVRLKEPSRSLGKKVVQQYPEITPGHLIYTLRLIQEMIDDVRLLVGKKVLDLACGSTKSPDRSNGWDFISRFLKGDETAYDFEPYFCRIMKVAGADVIGIDSAENSHEAFESLQLDLTDPATLEIFPDKSFDIVNNQFFTVSRDSWRTITGNSPALCQQLAKKNGLPPEHPHGKELAFEFDDLLFKNANRLLSKGGLYARGEFLYRKTGGGQLLKVKTMHFEGSASAAKKK